MHVFAMRCRENLSLGLFVDVNSGVSLPVHFMLAVLDWSASYTDCLCSNSYEWNQPRHPSFSEHRRDHEAVSMAISQVIRIYSANTVNRLLASSFLT